MNIKSAIQFKPQPVSTVIKKLSYPSDSIYSAIEKMLKDSNIVKILTYIEGELGP